MITWVSGLYSEFLPQADSALLILLDLSAAFDTADHEVLIKYLHDMVGIHETTLNRFHSFLVEKS